jgi:hypothetical protein
MVDEVIQVDCRLPDDPDDGEAELLAAAGDGLLLLFRLNKAWKES